MQNKRSFGSISEVPNHCYMEINVVCLLQYSFSPDMLLLKKCISKRPTQCQCMTANTVSSSTITNPAWIRRDKNKNQNQKHSSLPAVTQLHSPIRAVHCTSNTCVNLTQFNNCSAQSPFLLLQKGNASLSEDSI